MDKLCCICSKNECISIDDTFSLVQPLSYTIDGIQIEHATRHNRLPICESCMKRLSVKSAYAVAINKVIDKFNERLEKLNANFKRMYGIVEGGT